MLTTILVFVIAPYLIGSIPFGPLLARLRGIDLRQVGSGNIGATNAARALGKTLGVVVFLCDAAKGWLPIWLGLRFLDASDPTTVWWVALIGFECFLGHLTSPWVGFRGGKGVATALGVFLGISPWATLIAVGVFGIVFALKRIVSLASLVAISAFFPALWLFHPRWPMFLLATILWTLIVWRHRDNIERLMQGKEKRL